MARTIQCGSSCFLGRKGCKSIRDCACRCGPLKSINPNLFDGCVDQCNSAFQPLNHQDYLCRYVGGDVLFNNFGILDCGYDLKRSAQYQAMNIQQSQSGWITKGLIVILGILVTIAVLHFIILKK